MGNVRENTRISTVPTLMLTTRKDEAEVVKGLNVDTDDYLTKPFDDTELLARVNALFRRIPIKKVEQNIIKSDGYELDTNKFTLNFQNKRVVLTMKEYKIIEALIKNPLRIVDSHIRNLREKLKNAEFPTDKFLLTVWRIGHKWK